MLNLSRKTWSEVKYWVIIMLVMAFLFEMFSSIFFSYKYGGGKLAIWQVAERLITEKPDLSYYHKVHDMVRPDSGKTVNRQIADEIWDANKYTYEPWLQFRVSDIKSKYVNVNGFERKSIPELFSNPRFKDTLDVYFLGGSTMYGYNVSDAETIPSQFLRLYMKKFPKGRPMRVKNLGVPYYFSKQELMLLSKLIFEGHRPEIVIFLDGLNDFYPSRMLYYDKPHFSYAMQQVFDEKIFLNSKRTIVDSSEQYYIDPDGVPPNEYYESLLQKYTDHVRLACKLSEQTGIKSYFFCQPVPFYNFPNRDKDPISFKVSYPRFDYIYPRLEKMAGSLKNFTFLGNMLTNAGELPFVDQVHYSPAFNRKIAEHMLHEVERTSGLIIQ